MRIRTIKPEFWSNEDLSRLDYLTVLLAIGLLNYADDEGYFNANPALIRAALFPLRDVSGIDTVSLRDLSSVGYVRLYSGEGGRVYGHVVNFKRHQVINKPKASKLKPLCLPDQEIRYESGIDTVSIRSGTGNREQGTGKGTAEIEPSVRACEGYHPTEAEVLARSDMIGLVPWKALDWFNEMEGCGWRDHQGRQVQKWESVLSRVKVKWEADGRPSGPPKSTGYAANQRTDQPNPRNAHLAVDPVAQGKLIAAAVARRKQQRTPS